MQEVNTLPMLVTGLGPDLTVFCLNAFHTHFFGTQRKGNGSGLGRDTKSTYLSLRLVNNDHAGETVPSPRQQDELVRTVADW